MSGREQPEPDRDLISALRSIIPEWRRVPAGLLRGGREAVIPDWEQPLHRFLMGDSELRGRDDGRVFTLWEALLYMRPCDFPIVVGDLALSEQDVETQAALLLEIGGSEGFWSLDSDTRAGVIEKLLQRGWERDFFAELFWEEQRRLGCVDDETRCGGD